MSDQNLLPPSINISLPVMIKRELPKMSATDQEEFLRNYRAGMKTGTMALMCWFVTAHFLYLKRPLSFIAFWILASIAAGVCLFSGSAEGAWAMAGIPLVWWMLDLFRMGGYIAAHNTDLAIDIFRNLKVINEKKKAEFHGPKITITTGYSQDNVPDTLCATGRILRFTK
jgi:fructose-specific phosphotransferase system IIC component